jgi:hypothetical protein
MLPSHHYFCSRNNSNSLILSDSYPFTTRSNATITSLLLQQEQQLLLLFLGSLCIAYGRFWPGGASLGSAQRSCVITLAPLCKLLSTGLCQITEGCRGVCGDNLQKGITKGISLFVSLSSANFSQTTRSLIRKESNLYNHRMRTSNLTRNRRNKYRRLQNSFRVGGNGET